MDSRLRNRIKKALRGVIQYSPYTRNNYYYRKIMDRYFNNLCNG